MTTVLDNLSNGVAWKDCFDTWSSVKTWDSYTDLTSLTNLE